MCVICGIQFLFGQELLQTVKAVRRIACAILPDLHQFINCLCRLRRHVWKYEKNAQNMDFFIRALAPWDCGSQRSCYMGVSMELISDKGSVIL